MRGMVAGNERPQSVPKGGGEQNLEVSLRSPCLCGENLTVPSDRKEGKPMNRNKIVGVLLILMGVLTLPFRAVALEVSIESKEVQRGDTMPLKVHVNGATELGNVAFDLEYDGMELEMRKVVPGEVLEGALFAMNPETFPSSSGLFRFNGVLPQGFTGSGDLLRLTFSLSDTAQGSFPVTFKKLTAATIHLKDVAAAHQNGGFTVKTGVSEEEVVALPEATQLLSNYPNPFNVGTYIPYQLSEPSEVEIRIYSVDGRLVRTMDLGHRPAGYYLRQGQAAYWDGRDEKDRIVASGVYMCRLQAGRLRFTQKLVMVK